GSPISVSIHPPDATIQAFGQQQFQSTVQNSSNTSVTWAVDGVGGGNSAVGTVSNSGLYQAPGNAGNHSVTATSAADSTKSASASVTVTAPPAIAVTTRDFDNFRSGTNTHETILTPANANAQQFGKLM